MTVEQENANGLPITRFGDEDPKLDMLADASEAAKAAQARQQDRFYDSGARLLRLDEGRLVLADPSAPPDDDAVCAGMETVLRPWIDHEPFVDREGYEWRPEELTALASIIAPGSGRDVIARAWAMWDPPPPEGPHPEGLWKKLKHLF